MLSMTHALVDAFSSEPFVSALRLPQGSARLRNFTLACKADGALFLTVELVHMGRLILLLEYLQQRLRRLALKLLGIKLAIVIWVSEFESVLQSRSIPVIVGLTPDPPLIMSAPMAPATWREPMEDDRIIGLEIAKLVFVYGIDAAAKVAITTKIITRPVRTA